MPSRPASTGSASSLDSLLNDSDISKIQAARLAELKASQPVTIAASAPGHGQPTTMSEPEAISTTASSETSLLLFTHPSMATCTTMEAHLAQISRRRPEVMCIIVQAEKCEWLAGKLGVRVLPALVGFVAGKEVGRIVGFEGIDGGKGGGWKAVERSMKGWHIWKDDGRRDSEDSQSEEETKTKRRGIRDSRPRRPEDDDSDWD